MNLESNVGLVAKLLNNPEFRDAYVFEHIKTGVAYQMRALRGERDWTQAKLGEMAKKPRNVITRLEDPNYGQFSIQTLREIAAAFNVALLVKFVPFSRLLEEYDNVSPEVLASRNINDPKEVRHLKRWATAKDKVQSRADREQATPARTLTPTAYSVSGADMLFLDKPRGKRKESSQSQVGKRTIETVSSIAKVFRFPQAA